MRRRQDEENIFSNQDISWDGGGVKAPDFEHLSYYDNGDGYGEGYEGSISGDGIAKNIPMNFYLDTEDTTNELL